MPTIDGALRATASRVPDAEALSFDGNEFTYAELDEAVERTACALAELGVVKGDRVALMSTNSDRFIIAFYAAHRLGAIFVPINPSSAPPEIEYLLDDSGSAVFLFDPALATAVDTTVTNGLPSSCRHAVALGAVGEHPDLFALAADSPATRPDVQIQEDDDALILYTSGTTGKPKGALFDHHRSMWVGVNMIATCGMRVGDRFLHVAPLFHAAELCIMLMPGTMVGAKHVVLNGFDPAVVADTMESERITMFFGVPTMFQFLLKVPDLAERDLSAWRTGLFGAAPMPASAVEELVSTLPQVDFMQLCGQTEGGPGGIYSDAAQVRERPDASGRQALPFTECRVVDPDGHDVEAGDTGELILRGETIMKEYWNKPEATAETIADGWLHTGDLARVDADGYMTLVDRMKDMIITGGHNVYSVEVENALAAHPDIADCAIVGRPHADYGESIVAVVTPIDGKTITLDQIKTFCKEQVSSYKVPHELIVRTIPRNPSGKIMKHVIRAEMTEPS
jgi:fatty-acyl-CoA synthase